MPDDLLTTAELAARWGWKPESLKAWRNRRQGPPYIRLGPNRVRYRLADVRAYERARRVDPSAMATTR